MKKYKFYIYSYIFIFVIYLTFLLVIYRKTDEFNYYHSNNLINYKMLKELQDEYNLLKENYSFVTAMVLDSSLNKADDLFIINRGSNDFVREKSFVVNEDGLVGIVVKVYNNYSIVRSIYSGKTKIAVEINNCYGTLNVKNKQFIVDDLINCSNVDIGDAIFTSKYNYSSSNILVGYIKSINTNFVSLTPAINPYKVKFVGVIIKS